MEQRSPPGGSVGGCVEAIDLALKLHPDRPVPPLGHRTAHVVVVVEDLEAALRCAQVRQWPPAPSTGCARTDSRWPRRRPAHR